MQTYRRETDGLLMVELSRHNAVNILAARKLGLIAAGIRFAEPDRKGGVVDAGARTGTFDEMIADIGPVAPPHRPRPTDAEFDELKRQRDAAMEATVARVCAEHGLDRGEMLFHASHAGACCCACPDGPCQHVWDGPDHEEDCLVSATCSRCGTVAAYHDMRVMP
jgi:hypothetical protein